MLAGRTTPDHDGPHRTMTGMERKCGRKWHRYLYGVRGKDIPWSQLLRGKRCRWR